MRPLCISSSISQSLHCKQRKHREGFRKDKWQVRSPKQRLDPFDRVMRLFTHPWNDVRADLRLFTRTTSPRGMSPIKNIYRITPLVTMTWTQKISQVGVVIETNRPTQTYNVMHKCGWCTFIRTLMCEIVGILGDCFLVPCFSNIFSSPWQQWKWRQTYSIASLCYIFQ